MADGVGSFRTAWRWWFGIPLALRVAISVWLALLIGVLVRVLVQKSTAQSVVPIYLTAGERWLASAPLYPPIPGTDLYRNPPGVAAVFAPLTALHPKAAALLWRAACVIPYLLGVRSLIRDVLPALSVWRRAVIWTLAAVLVIPAFNNGQINLMIVAAAVCGVGACARQQWWAAAFWLAFAGWWKVYPLAVGLLCVLVAPRQLGGRLAVMTVLLFGLPFLLQQPAYVWDRHVEFVHEMRLDDRTQAHVALSRVPRDWTIIPRLWGEVVVTREMAQIVGLVVAAGMAAVVLFCREPKASGVQSSSRPSHGRTVWVFPLLLGLIWITLFGPSTEMNTYSVLAPAAGVLAVGSNRKRVSVCGWVGAGLLLAAIVRGSFPSDGPYKLRELQPIAAGILLIGSVAWSRRSHPG